MKTTFSFCLPHGYIDADGEIHRDGLMRLARAMDEISAVQDPRVKANEAYLPVLIFSKVIQRLGQLETVTPQVVESLFASDLAYLEDLYQRINSLENIAVGAICPRCSMQFQLRVAPL